MKKILIVGIATVSVLLFGCEEQKPQTAPTEPEQVQAEEKTEQVEEKEVKKENINWEEKIDEIIETGKDEYNKITRTNFLSDNYQPTKEDITSFFDDIVKEYGTGNYLTDRTNDRYMLENYFKAQVVYNHSTKGTLEYNFSLRYSENVEFAFKNAFDVQKERLEDNEEVLSAYYASVTGKENINKIVAKTDKEEVKEVKVDYHNPITELDENKVQEVIKEDVEQEWKDNYFMIERQIERQTDAYNNLKELDLDKTKEEILNNAFQEWGYNFFMVERTYERQLEAYNNIYN